MLGAVRFFIRTLGCKLNQLDSAQLAASLARAGHEPVGSEAEADWVVVNTCTVTAESDRKSRQAAHGALRGARGLAVLGCSVRTQPARWRSLVPGALVCADAGALLARFDAAPAAVFPLTSRTRVPVAVQAGCDDLCAFCLTRIARGPHRSLPAEQVLAQVHQAEARGVREVVLTGVNTAAWGCRDTRHPWEARLAELLARLLRDTSIPRIRLSSLGPQYLDAAFFEVFADPRLCDHLHLSVQSASAGVLRRMARGHGVDEVAGVAEAARAARPGVALTADLIAGFPGERAAEHAETLATVAALGFARLHVFPFSAREGTAAAAFADQLPAEVKRERARELRALGDRLRAEFLAQQHGRTGEVLAERDGTGLTTNYIRLRVPDVPEGELAPVVIGPETLAERGGPDTPLAAGGA
jgi:threonylcarbamoyladenosine tRNA methylthiotransferase MtaB